MLRRARFGEFSAGAFIASLPGSIQSVLDYANTKTVPNTGHLVEIGLAIFFFALTLRAIFNFTEPTSSEAFRELFPNSKHGMTFPKWCGCKIREFREGVKGL